MQQLRALSKELQWTAMSAKVGAVTISSEGGDLGRQLAAAGRAARARDRAMLETSAAPAPAQEDDDGQESEARAHGAHGAAQGCAKQTHAGGGLLDLHEEYVRLRSIRQLVQFRPVVLEAAFGEDPQGQNEQRHALKAALA
jgi:hypothetical protein